MSLYVDQSFEESNWQQSCYPIHTLNNNHALPEEEWFLEPAALELLDSEENPYLLMDYSNNLHETVFLPGPLPPPHQSIEDLNNPLLLSKKPKNLALVKKAPSKQLCRSNMAQQPFYYPYRDKIVVTGKQIMTDTHRVSNTSVPHTSCSTTTYDNSTTTPPLNYTTSPYSSAAAYIDNNTNTNNCCTQSSPVAQVPSISGTSAFDQVDYYNSSSSCFEPIYYTSDVSLCQDYGSNTVTTSEKSVDDWIQYLYSDDEGCPSYEEEPLGLNCDSLFPEFAEEDLTMLDTILAEETFSDKVDLPFLPQQQDMPAGSSAASPQYHYLPEEAQPQQSQPQVIQYIPIAPKPSGYPAQSLSPTSSTSSTTTTTTENTRSRKRQRIEFNNSEEEYRIKRDLNNKASAKSRQKKREQQEHMKLEKVRLESRNRQLKNEVEEFERQIATLKDILYSKIKK